MTLVDHSVEKAPTIAQVSSEDEEDSYCESNTNSFVSEDTKKTLQRVRMSLSVAKSQFEYLKTQQTSSSDLENKNDDAAEKDFEKNATSEESGDGPSKMNKTHNRELQYPPTYEVYVVSDVGQSKALSSEETNDNPVVIRSELKWVKEIMNNLQIVNQQMAVRLATVEKERDEFHEKFETTTESCNKMVEELRQCQTKIEFLETELKIIRRKKASHKHNNSNHCLKSCPDKKYLKTAASTEKCKINESNALLAEIKELTNSNASHTHTNSTDDTSVCPLSIGEEKATSSDKTDTLRTFLNKNCNEKMSKKESESGVQIMHCVCYGDDDKITRQLKSSQSNYKLIEYNQNVEASNVKRRKISSYGSSRKNSSMHQTEVIRNTCDKSSKKCLKSEVLSELDAKISGIFNPFKISIQIPENTPDIKIQHLSTKKYNAACDKNNVRMKTLTVEIRNPTDLRRLISQVPQVKDYLRSKFDKRERGKKCGACCTNADRERSGDWKSRISRGEECDIENERTSQSTDSSFISIPEDKLNTMFCRPQPGDVTSNKLACGSLKSCLKPCDKDSNSFQNDPCPVLRSVEEKKVIFDQNIEEPPTQNQKPKTSALDSLKIRCS